MTLNDWAYSMLNVINPLLVDDEEVSLRQVKNWIVQYRAEFLKNNLNSHRQLESNLVQTIPNLELQFVSTGNDGTRFFRTTRTIPDIIILSSGAAVSRVGPDDLTQESFKYITDIKAVTFSGHGRFNKYKPFAYRMNDYIYIKSKDPLFPIDIDNKISITAVFSDPREIAEFNSTTSPVYSDEHTDFPLNIDIMPFIENAIKKDKFRFTESSNPDKVNDGQDNSDNVKG